MPQSPLAQSIDAFINDLIEVQRRDKQTAANYRHYLNRFLKITRAQSPHQINRETVEQFRQWLQSRAGKNRLRPSTANYHLTALRSFLKYLHHHGTAALNPTDVALQPIPIRPVTTVETPLLNRMLDLPLNVEGRAVIQHRDRAILELLATTGLRVGEISRLRKDHVVGSRGELTIPGRKGSLRIVPLGNQTRYWIMQYLKLRKDSAPQLFLRHDPAAGRKKSRRPTDAPSAPQGLTPRSIQRLIKKYARAVGLGRTVQPRTIRHTVAANLLSSGHDLETVRRQLGHASLATTKIYALPPRPTVKTKPQR